MTDELERCSGCGEYAGSHISDKIATLQSQLAEARELIGDMRHCLASDTGFMSAVRQDTGKAYPWEPWEVLEPRVLAALKDQSHDD
jgi:hypothetical protein